MGRPPEGNLPRWMAWAHASSNWSEPRSGAGRLSRTQPLRAGVRLPSLPRGAPAGSAPALSPHKSRFGERAAEAQVWQERQQLAFSANEAESRELQPQVSRERPFCREKVCCAVPSRQTVVARRVTSHSLRAEVIHSKNSICFLPENNRSPFSRASVKSVGPERKASCNKEEGFDAERFPQPSTPLFLIDPQSLEATRSSSS